MIVRGKYMKENVLKIPSLAHRGWGAHFFGLEEREKVVYGLLLLVSGAKAIKKLEGKNTWKFNLMHKREK